MEKVHRRLRFSQEYPVQNFFKFLFNTFVFMSKFQTLCGNNEARDSAVGCGTALHTRMSRVH